MTVEEAAARIRVLARTNYTSKQLGYDQLMALAKELDGKDPDTADSVYTREQLRKKGEK